MRLLLDQTLPRHLIARLADQFPESRHVTDLGLDTASGREIWDCAGEHGYSIVSEDSDFRQLAFLFRPPPKAIWLAVGNAATPKVLDVLVRHQLVIEEFVRAEDEALLVLPGLPASPA